MNLSKVMMRQMEKDFLMFLNEEKILNDLELIAVEYEKNIRNLTVNDKFYPPLRFQFKLDFEKVKSFSENLYRLFIKEPLAGFKLAKNVIYCAVDLIVLSIPFEMSDLQIVPQVINLSTRNEISCFLLRPSHELQCLRGVLLSKTTIDTYVCEMVSCHRGKWKRYSGSSCMTCPDCCSFMKEHVSSADLGERFYCQFLSLKAYHKTGRFQALPVNIKDELCTTTEFNIGEEYIITGYLTGKDFQAINIQTVNSETRCFTEVPESIANLRFEISQTQEDCPWSFVIALSSLIGSFIIPSSSFLNLKIGLMLSLATVESYSPVPLLAVGSDLLNVQILFQAAGKFIEKHVNHFAANTFLGGLLKPGLKSDLICQEAGQLILAAGGVCDIGDWSKYKKEQTNYICQTLESGQVLLNKSECGKNNFTNFVPLKCAIWTYYCNSGKSRNHESQLKTLINVFGVPFLADEIKETEIVKICWNNLNTTVKRLEGFETGSRVSTDDFKKYFKIINSREVTLSEAASQLIRSYFVVSRRDRHQCLPIAAVQTMTSLAEAHARLALRNEVLFEDAVAVIYLYEEVMTNLYGESVLPYPKVACNENEPVYFWVSQSLMVFIGSPEIDPENEKQYEPIVPDE